MTEVNADLTPTGPGDLSTDEVETEIEQLMEEGGLDKEDTESEEGDDDSIEEANTDAVP